MDASSFFLLSGDDPPHALQDVRNDGVRWVGFVVVPALPEAAARELELFFPEGIVDYDYAAFHWIYDPVEELKK